MLELGRFSERVCQRVSRRSLLRIGSLGVLGGLSWADCLRRDALAAGRSSPTKRPKSVIVLWLWGGPPHLDLFDLKPKAPLEYRGPYEPISTAVPGLQIGELLPRLAKQSHRYALIRSMVSGSQDHGVAGTIGLTGSASGAIDLGGKAAGGSVRPATGSIVARVRGFAPDKLPPYVILGNLLHQGLKRVVGEGAGTLGAVYDPFRVGYSLEEGVQLPYASLPKDLQPEQLRARQELLRALDGRLHASLSSPVSASPSVATMDRYYDLAMSLIASGTAKQVLELEREPAAVRDRYGFTRFGRSCLLARRLVEDGIPFVQVNWSTHVEPHEDAGDGGWDMHDRNFQQLQDRHAWIFDQSLSALLDDLARRGLLETTLVCAVGEFGRTPKINNKAGRDHWPNVYSALLAGGGVRGGAVVGASDARAEQVAHRPVTPADLGATLLEAIGIGVTEQTQLSLIPQGNAVRELF